MLSPPIVRCHRSWHLLTGCREGHPWPCSQDRTPLFPVSQKPPSRPGLCSCSPPVSANSPFPRQKRWRTVNTQPTEGCFTLQAQESSGSRRTWTIQQDYLKNGSLPIHYHLLLLPEHAWAAPAPFLHPGTPRWLAKQRHGQDPQPKSHGCYSCSQNWPHSSKPLRRGEGGLSASARYGAQHTTPRTASLWHPQHPTPRRSHLRAIFWCVCSFG